AKLRNVADIYDKPDLRLIQASIHFDFPANPLPANVRYAGPVLDDPDWVKDWLNPWPQDDPRPLAVVSLSSTFQNQQETIQQCINALGQLNVRGLVTAGPAMSREEFTVPQNVTVIPNGSHAQIFPFADIVITHAGHGTVMRALRHGVPLLCLPMGRDQDDNAAKVAYRKAGIRLGKNAGAAKIKNAVSAILGDKSFKDNAERLGQLIREEAGKNRAVAYLESLVEATGGQL
ncbi:MAG TPA: glycosyltransferase, partial [Agriterribacter sp.]|nr:glycosyltransferase [Agriterribacter sp.]